MRFILSILFALSCLTLRAQPASAILYCSRVRSAGVAGYRFSYGPQDHTVTNSVDSPTPQATITNLTYGQRYFAFVQSFVSNGITSFPSPEVAYVAVPASPTITQTNWLFTVGPLILQQSTDSQSWRPVGTNYAYFTLPVLTGPGVWTYRVESIGPVQIRLQP